MSEGLDAIEAALEPDEALIERVVEKNVEWEGRIFSVEHLRVGLSDGLPRLARGGAPPRRRRRGGGARRARVPGAPVSRGAGADDARDPAGKVDPDEPRDVCAARELTEETGLVADRLELLAESYGAPGFTNEHTSVYFAHGLTQGEAAPDEGEFLNVLWVGVEDAVEAIRRGLIDDAKTVTGILAARAYGLL